MAKQEKQTETKKVQEKKIEKVPEVKVDTKREELEKIETPPLKPENAVVRILQKAPSRLRVLFKDGTTGWIKK